VIRRLACLAILFAARRLRKAGRDRPGAAVPDGAAGAGAARRGRRRPRSREFADGRGLRVAYRLRLPGAPAETRFAECRFRFPGRPQRPESWSP